jgi:aryl-alcohol dehydrogenase-like predicted oxidoreductase
MEYRTLGRTGVKVSPLCMGTMLMGGPTSPEDSHRIIDRAIEAGLNFFDTANIYLEGRSEEVLGEALARNGRRDRVIVATKVHGKVNAADPNAQGNSRRHIIAQCEASLRRLRTGHIDLYQIHRPQPSVPIDETLGALDDLVRAGKVRYLGTSTFGAWQIVEALWAARELRLNRFVCDQPPYNLLDRRIERELVPMAQTYGLALIPYSPLAGGLLTGKYRRDQAPPADSRYGDVDRNVVHRRRYIAGTFDVVDGLEPIALEKGCTLAQLALAWCVQQPGITSPIIGLRTVEQLEGCLAALALAITPEDRERIDALNPPGRVVAPYYETNFGPNARW